MCWTGIIVGMIAGVCIGVMIAARLSAAERHEAEDHSRETPIDLAMIDGAEEVPDELSPLPKPETYFDRYPHS
jgi:hypothetical protein